MKNAWRIAPVLVAAVPCKTHDAPGGNASLLARSRCSRASGALAPALPGPPGWSTRCHRRWLMVRHGGRHPSAPGAYRAGEASSQASLTGRLVQFRVQYRVRETGKGGAIRLTSVRISCVAGASSLSSTLVWATRSSIFGTDGTAMGRRSRQGSGIGIHLGTRTAWGNVRLPRG